MEPQEKPAPGKAPPRRRVRRIIWRIVRVMLLAYVGLAAVLFFFQSWLIYHPTSGLLLTPQAYSLAYEDVHFEASDGVKLHGWFVPAENAGGVVLFCHGNAGNISHRLDTLRIFHDLGLSTFIFDYRGYGRSDGSPGEEGTYLDAEAAWRHLTEERKVTPGDIIFFGRSLGGAVAAHLATEHTPSRLVLESTFTSIPDRGAEIYPYMPVRLLSRFDYNTLESVRKVRCPVLVIHSRDDGTIPFHHGERIFAAANAPKKFLEIAGSHNDGFLAAGKRYTDALRDFLIGKSDSRDAGSPRDP